MGEIVLFIISVIVLLALICGAIQTFLPRPYNKKYQSEKSRPQANKNETGEQKP